MANESKTQLKSYFQLGDKPNQAQFENLIDSMVDADQAGYPIFSTFESYVVDDVVAHEGKLYKFISDHAPGAWLGTDAIETSIKAETDVKLTELESRVEECDGLFGITIGERQRGGYYFNNALTSGEGTYYEPVNVSMYKGKKLRFKLSKVGASDRRIGFANSADTSSIAWTSYILERTIVANEYTDIEVTGDYLFISYFNSIDIEVMIFDESFVYANIVEKVDSIELSIDSIKNNLFVGGIFIDLGKKINGAYYFNNALTSGEGFYYKPIDVSAYLGKTLKVKVENAKESNRRIGFANSADTSSIAWTSFNYERYFIENNSVEIVITGNYLYVSATYNTNIEVYLKDDSSYYEKVLNIDKREWVYSCVDLQYSKGYYVMYSNGALQSSPDYSSSEYMELQPETLELRCFVSLPTNMAGVAFYDSDKGYISGYQFGGVNIKLVERVFPIPSRAKYFRICCQTYLVEQSYVIASSSKKELSNMIDAIQWKVRRMMQLDYKVGYANAKEPIFLKTYLGDSQIVHPSVLYFNKGFAKYQYWMAYTPYPDGQTLYENPCVAYSNDGKNWIDYSGNPLDSTDDAAKYNSDAALVYNSTLHQLELWWRYVDSVNGIEYIYRAVTTDGQVWSAKELMQEGAVTAYLSPCIKWDETSQRYMIFVVDTTSSWVVKNYESSDGKNWSLVRTIDLDYTYNNKVFLPWHIDIIEDKDVNQWILTVMCKQQGNINASSNWVLFKATSSDLENWETPSILMLPNEIGWDRGLYKACLVKVGEEYRLYYSARKGYVYHLGLSVADSLWKFFGE